MSGNQSLRTASGKYKPWFDITILVLAHLLFFPIFLLLWTGIPILIWLEDRGPVFYKQRRVGKNGLIFSVLKFRTMVKDAESRGPAWTTEGDPRVTRVGRMLRRTALDELPEVLNIWKREMSFVGPRALDVEEQKSLEQMVPGFENRLQVLPGLTGLAQVYDPADEAQNKFRYDSEYLECMNPWLDMKLLVLSVRNTFGAKWDQRRGKPTTDYEHPASSDPDDQRPDPTDEGHVKAPTKR